MMNKDKIKWIINREASIMCCCNLHLSSLTIQLNKREHHQCLLNQNPTLLQLSSLFRYMRIRLCETHQSSHQLKTFTRAVSIIPRLFQNNFYVCVCFSMKKEGKKNPHLQYFFLSNSQNILAKYKATSAKKILFF